MASSWHRFSRRLISGSELPSDAGDLDRHRLRAAYLEYRENGFFAATGLLYGLCRIAWRAAKDDDPLANLIATSLAQTFCDAANRMEGIPITEDQGGRWFTLLDQPILRCLDVLTGKSAEAPGAVLADLASAYAKVRAEISN